MPKLRSCDRVVAYPRVKLFSSQDGLVGLSSKGELFGLGELDEEGLRALLKRCDGRTVGEIVDELGAEYDPNDLLTLMEQLIGTLVEVASETGAAAPKLESVAVLGSGRLAAAIQVVLGGVAQSVAHVEFTGGAALDAKALSARLLVCAIEEGSAEALIGVARACQDENLPVLFVSREGSRWILGPLTLPGRSPCYVCSRLSTRLRTHFDSVAAEILPHLPIGSATDAPGWVVGRLVEEVLREVERFAAGCAYPKRLTTLLEIDDDGALRTEWFDAVSVCPVCGGHHLGEVRTDASAAPPLKAMSSGAVCEDVGGTRTLSGEEAEARARRALARLAVDVSCEPLPANAPDQLSTIACPFFRAEHSVRFQVDAPVLFSRLWEPSFGKGATEQQARCSALFEWLERNLAAWRGEQDLVRAAYRDVASHAIDVPFYTSGLLPGFRSPGRRVFDDTEVIDWVWATCLRSERPILVPAASVFLGSTLFLGSQLDLPKKGSSGLSAGCSVADATLQGLLEIVERDATYTAIRNGKRCPEIAVESITDPASLSLFDRIAQAGYVPHVREITSGIGIPTFEVYLVRPREYLFHYAAGYGAHLDPRIALRRAVTEAAQALFFAAAMGQEDALQAHSSYFEVFPHRALALTRKAETRRFDSTPTLADGKVPVVEQIRLVVDRISKAVPEADVCFVDLSVSELVGVHVVRAFVSGMLDEVDHVQVHIPERCRLVPLDEMYLGPLAL